MSQSSSSTRAHPKIPAEKKPFEQVQVGEVILAPTPGIQELNQKINFVYSRSGRQGTQVHDQLVLHRNEDKKELITVLPTSLGMVGRKGEKDIWDRFRRHKPRICTEDEWGAGLKYLCPVEPNTYRDEDVKKYDQPKLQIKYAQDTRLRHPPPLLRWVSVAHVYNIKPKEERPLPGSAKNEVGRLDADERQYYFVQSGLKFDETDCAEALRITQEREVMLHGTAKRGSKAPEGNKNVSERNEEEGEEEIEEGEDGWTKVENKKKSNSENRKKGKKVEGSSRHHRRR